jgi:hypothetical protein
VVECLIEIEIEIGIKGETGQDRDTLNRLWRETRLLDLEPLSPGGKLRRRKSQSQPDQTRAKET